MRLARFLVYGLLFTAPLDAVSAADSLVGAWRNAGATDSRALVFRFDANGAYRFDYRARLVVGALASATETTEVGRYTFANGVLRLEPERHDGWIYNMSPKNKIVLAETNSPPRRYRVREEGGVLVFEGLCAPFQINTYCRDRNDRAVDAEFRLQPDR